MNSKLERAVEAVAMLRYADDTGGRGWRDTDEQERQDYRIDAEKDLRAAIPILLEPSGVANYAAWEIWTTRSGTLNRAVAAAFAARRDELLEDT